MLVTVGAVYDAADFQGLFVFYTALEKCVIHLQLFALGNLDENSRRKEIAVELGRDRWRERNRCNCQKNPSWYISRVVNELLRKH